MLECGLLVSCRWGSARAPANETHTTKMSIKNSGIFNPFYTHFVVWVRWLCRAREGGTTEGGGRHKPGSQEDTTHPTQTTVQESIRL